jgi:hypothetical protein
MKLPPPAQLNKSVSTKSMLNFLSGLGQLFLYSYPLWYIIVSSSITDLNMDVIVMQLLARFRCYHHFERIVKKR